MGTARIRRKCAGRGNALLIFMPASILERSLLLGVYGKLAMA